MEAGRTAFLERAVVFSALLERAVVFSAIALIAAVLGPRGVVGLAIGIAKRLVIAFVVLAVGSSLL